MSTAFDLTGELPTGRLVIEASAGTGKTYSLSALVVRHVAELGRTPDQLLVVTYTRAAAAELRDRTRAALVAARAAFDDPAAAAASDWLQRLVTGAPDDVAQRRDRVVAAIASFDDATITTIHGFCQITLRQLGLRSGTMLDSELGDSSSQVVEEVCRDLLIAQLVENPRRLDWPTNGLTPTAVLGALTSAVKALLGNPGATPIPNPATATPGKNDPIERLARWVALVSKAAEEVGQRRRARQELGYDDLITGLHSAIDDPQHGPAVIEWLRQRYALVMVDEFQDTDPVQWQIFERPFHDRLVTVGDPKQAIYRFRGADVHAYLRATQGAATVHLATNWRSDADLVAATNALVDGVEFGHQRIVGTAVAAAPTAATRALAPGHPLQMRWLRPDASLLSPTGKFSTPLGRRAIVRDLAATVVDLLSHHTITGKRGTALVRPGDIAVLVPNHSNADSVSRALARAGVPAVRTRTGSVFVTPAATEWAILLAAMERPASAPTARAAGLGVFLRRRPIDLDPEAPDAAVVLGELQRHLATWAERLTTRSFLAWYDQVRAESNLVPQLLGDPDGERRLTDLDHIAEQLAAELGATGATAPSAHRLLDRLRADASVADELGDQMRRIDSDAQAVQVTTLHSSKGLEYPVVLLPLQWQIPTDRGPSIYTNPDGDRVIDVATKQKWSGAVNEEKPAAREHYAATEAYNDRLRLLYVGLTRAEHRTVLWWAPGIDAHKSSANVVLFDRDDTGTPLNTRPTITFGQQGGPKPEKALIPNPDPATTVHRLAVLTDRSGGTIEVAECPAQTPSVLWAPAAEAGVAPVLGVAPTGGRRVADPMWRHWSFTSITKTLDVEWSLAVPSAPVTGGNDEAEVADDANDPAVVEATSNAASMPLADVVAGAEFGTLVHSVLEQVDPASATLLDDLQRTLRAQAARDGVVIDTGLVAKGLLAAVETPLGSIAEGKRLADIPTSDRLTELTFDMPLHSSGVRPTAVQIGEVLLAHLGADDPIRKYAHELAEGRFTVDLAGHLQGSIDAVLRVADDAGKYRYLLVDYKTNRLHQRGATDPLAAYHPSLLPAAMAHSDYPLQALLYSVAVHRYLRWRLGAAYVPDDHLGGVAYLFVRGMVGAATPLVEGQPHGVFSWRPPAAAIVALDRLLATGVSS